MRREGLRFAPPHACSRHVYLNYERPLRGPTGSKVPATGWLVHVQSSRMEPSCT